MAQLACHMPLLGQRWPTGQNDVGPPVAANGGPTAGPPVAQRWPTGQNDVGPPVAANGVPTAEPPVAQCWVTGVMLSGVVRKFGRSTHFLLTKPR